MSFFLLGMPRCRSLWLSHLLSFADSYCFHEALSVRAGLLAPTLPKIFGYSNVGSADTNPINFDYKLVGESPLVIIERPLDDIISSLKTSFNYDDYDDPDNIIESMYNKLQNIQTPNTKRIKFSDLNDLDCVVDVMEFCGVRVDMHHVNKMVASKIVVVNDIIENSHHSINDHIRRK